MLIYTLQQALFYPEDVQQIESSMEIFEKHLNIYWKAYLYSAAGAFFQKNFSKKCEKYEKKNRI